MLVGSLEFAFTVINALFFLFVAFHKRRAQMKFIDKIQRIDETIKYSFKIKLNYSMYKYVSLVVGSIVLIYYNFVVTGVLYSYLVKIETGSEFATFVVYIVQSSSSGVFTFGFVGYVILIQARLTRINEKLQDIVRFPPETLEKHYKTKDALCMEMMRYTKMYKSFCSCVEDLNDIYGSSMVLQFAHDFTLLTTQIFGMFYFGSFEDPEKSLYQILALLAWMLPNIMKISFICFTCHTCRNEVGRETLRQL